jgi:hypothetical protein
MKQILSRWGVALVALVVATILGAPAGASSVSLVWVTGFDPDTTVGYDLGRELDLTTFPGTTVFLDIRVTADPATNGVQAASVSLSYDTSKLAATAVEVCPNAPGNSEGFVPGLVCGQTVGGDLELHPFGTASIDGVAGTVNQVAALCPAGLPCGLGNGQPVEFTLGRVRFDILGADSSVDGFYAVPDDGIYPVDLIGSPQYPR